MHNVHIIKFDFSLRWTDPLHIWTWRFEFAISHLNFPLKFLRAWRATKTLECSFQKYNTVISWNFFGVWYIVLQIFKTYAPWMKGAYYYLVIHELVWNFFKLFMKKLAQYSKNKCTWVFKVPSVIKKFLDKLLSINRRLAIFI